MSKTLSFTEDKMLILGRNAEVILYKAKLDASNASTSFIYFYALIVDRNGHDMLSSLPEVNLESSCHSFLLF